MWSKTKPDVVNETHRGPHAVVQRLGGLRTRPGRRHVVLRCPTSEHVCQFRGTETDHGTCEIIRKYAEQLSINIPVRTFLWPNLEFLDVHVRRVGDVVIGSPPPPRRCQSPPSTRTTRVHALSLHLYRSPGPTPPVAVRRILQEAKELANDESTDYTAAPLEVCCAFPSPIRKQTFTV